MSREATLERERRWARPVAIAAWLALLLFVVANVIVQTASLVGGDSEREQLVSVHSNSGRLVLAGVICTVGVALFAVPLAHLFRAAAARSPRVRSGLVGLAVLGPILMALGSPISNPGILFAVGADDAASTLVSLPHETREPLARFEAAARKSPKDFTQVTIYPKPSELEVERSNGQFTTVDYARPQAKRVTSLLGHESISTETDTAGLPGDARARHVIDNTGTLNAAQDLLFPAILATLIAVVYTGLWATRTGLLTRFAGTLGMALGASLLLIPKVSILALLIWAAYVGLVIVGRVRGGRPPAWDAGQAVPWPAPGQAAAPVGPDGTVEGSATEITGSPADAPRPAPRKRKRRS